MNKLLFVSASQYGYNSGIYYYTQHLKNYFKVTYFGLELGKKKIPSGGVILRQIPYKGMILTKIDFIREIFRLQNKNHYDFIIVFYFPGCSFLLLKLNQKRISIDIRTSAVISGNPIIEKLYNKIIKLEYGIFKNRTILSKNIAEYLKIKKKYIILPLGGEMPDYKCEQKDYSSLKLLYIGTFYDRKIEITIKGFSKFINNYNGSILCNYAILGFGSEEEISKIRETIKELNLEKFVHYMGEVRYPDSIKYFQEYNVGISFVPCTNYYNGQPPTKTFEYLVYGLPVIATNIIENKYVINNENGVLIEDSEDGFCKGLEHIFQNKDKYDNNYIQKNSLKYSYKEIVEAILKPYINSKICTR